MNLLHARTRGRRSCTCTFTSATLLTALLLLAACGGGSTPAAPPPAPLPPDAPTLTSVTTGDGIANIGWTASDDADTYTLYWAAAPGVTPATGTAIPGLTTLTYLQTGLAPAETYYYVVTATGEGGESEASNEMSGTLPPGVIEVFSISAGDALIMLEWEPVPGATSYALYKDTDPNVSPATGERIETAASAYTDDNVQNDVTYYYIVCALGEGGESIASLEVSATPQAPLVAPTGLTVTLMEETTQTLVIEWDPPAGTPPDGYNLYWDTEGDVDTGDNVLADVESPYIHTGLIGGTMYYYRVAGVWAGVVGPLSEMVGGTPRGARRIPGGGGSPGGGDEGLGNNLSWPALFADGYGITGQSISGAGNPWEDTNTGLRPGASETPPAFPYFNPADVSTAQPGWYPQKTSSTWQAGWALGPTGEPDLPANQVAVRAKWGDNLTSQSFSTRSVVRVETTLYQTIEPGSMASYEMKLLGGAGPTEVQGTNTEDANADTRHVYTTNGRLVIQKLDGEGGNPVYTLHDMPMVDRYGNDGPGTYGAEINVGGKIVYGYVWMLRTDTLPPGTSKDGWWRISFVLDDEVTWGGNAPVRNRVRITAADEPGEEHKPTASADGKSTSIEIFVNASSGGGGGGGGG